LDLKKINFAFLNYHESQPFLPSTLKLEIVPSLSLKTDHLTSMVVSLGGFSFIFYLYFGRFFEKT